jgi:hypothetical protein
MSARSFRVAFLAPFILTALAFAQQEICYSVHSGAAGASGVRSGGGAPSQVTAKANGQTITINPANGQSADSISSAQETAFQAAGFATRRVASNLFCITRGPGGAPIQRGGVYYNDDPRLELDTQVNDPNNPPNPATKPSGVLFPLPIANQAAQPVSGVISVMLYKRLAGGGTAGIAVPITLPPNQTGAQLQTVIANAFQANGLLTNRVQWPSAAIPSMLVDGLEIDRTAAGEQVFYADIYFDPGTFQLVPLETGAGVFPAHGATEYGIGTRGAAAHDPWCRVLGRPALGTTFSVVFELGLTGMPGGTMVGLTQPATPLPLGSGWLLVDPQYATFSYAVSDITAGTMFRTMTVPNNTNLIGLPLNFQAGAVHSSGAMTLSTAIAAVVGNY